MSPPFLVVPASIMAGISDWILCHITQFLPVSSPSFFSLVPSLPFFSAPPPPIPSSHSQIGSSLQTGFLWGAQMVGVLPSTCRLSIPWKACSCLSVSLLLLSSIKHHVMSQVLFLPVASLPPPPFFPASLHVTKFGKWTATIKLG